MVRVALVALVLLAPAARAELFDGVGGDELPPLITCWGACPPVAGEDFVSCLVLTHLDPFQCVVVARYHAPPIPRCHGHGWKWCP